METIHVQFSDDQQITIIASFSCPQDENTYQNLGEVDELDPRYIAFINPWSTLNSVALAARQERERLLRSTYDPGILMAQRALRMASTDADKAYASGKIAELDLYAEALVAITEQPGFPQAITWPVAPTK